MTQAQQADKVLVPAVKAPPAASASTTLGSLMLLMVRVIAGGVLCAAAFFKIRDPLTFSEAIQAFRIVKADHLILFGTYVLPWTELFAGLAMILGIWTRSAAFIYCCMMTLFIAVIIHALDRNLGGAPCGCFGYWHLYCKGGLEWCKVGENSVLLTLGLLVLGFGGGTLSLDHLVDRRFKPVV
jgi:uncharacterized membrane protein YphA (DoxX/SURF4 family)